MQLLKLRIFKTIHNNKVTLVKIFLVTNTLLLLTVFGLFFTTTISAQPIPEPHVPCNEERGEEFHSLRPYQASPCNPDISDYRLWCGNDIIPVQTFTVGPGDTDDCEPTSNGGQTCKYKYENQKIDIKYSLNFLNWA